MRTLYLLLLWALTACAATTPSNHQTDDPAVALYKSGDARAAKGDYDGAIAAYDAAQKANPQYAQVYYHRGVAWNNKGDYDRAIADYDIALNLAPQDADIYYWRGRAWYFKGNYDRAISDFEAALKINPAYMDATVILGNAWYNKGDYERAVDYFDAAVKIDPQDWFPYQERGVTRFFQGQFESADRDLTESLRLRPSGEAAMWLYLARARQSKNASSVLAPYAKGRASVWSTPISRFLLGEINYNQLIAAATANQNEAPGRDDQCYANFFAGELYLTRTSHQEATQAFRDAEKTCPKLSRGYINSVTELKRLAN